MTEKEKIARIFKAFCDTNRLTLLSLLQYGERCACELLEEVNIGQPTLSHHMKILCDSEIVVSRKSGKMTFYSLSEKGIENAKKILEQITEIKDFIPSQFVLQKCYEIENKINKNGII